MQPETVAKEAKTIVIEDSLKARRDVATTRKRILAEFWQECLDIAKLGGESIYYRWKQKGTDKETGEVITTIITGLSASAVVNVLHQMGNIDMNMEPVQETASSWIFTAKIEDLEKNFTVTRQFRMDKNFPVFGKHSEFRKNDIRFSIGVSKANRNAGKSLIPAGLEDAMIEVALGSTRGKIDQRLASYQKDIEVWERQNPGKKTKSAIRRYVEETITQFVVDTGIDEKDLVAKVGLPVEGWTAETLVQLLPDLKALQSGTMTVTEYLADINAENGDGKKTGVVSTTAAVEPGDPSTHQGHEPKGDEGKGDKDNGKTGQLGF